jgi:hypothetical protein
VAVRRPDATASLGPPPSRPVHHSLTGGSIARTAVPMRTVGTPRARRPHAEGMNGRLADEPSLRGARCSQPDVARHGRCHHPVRMMRGTGGRCERSHGTCCPGRCASESGWLRVHVGANAKADPE